MTAILAPFLYTLGPAALLLVMAVVFAETGLLLGFFLPGDSILFMTGALVATGVIALPFALVAGSVFAAAVFGDQVGYLIGRRYGPRVFAHTDARLFRQEYAERATAFFAKHGPVAVLLARFVPIVRTFVPVVAGVSRMPRRRFTTFNAGGAALWGIGIISVGFLFGGIPLVAGHIELITLALASLSVVPLSVEIVRWRRRRSVKLSTREPAPRPVILV